MSSWSEILFLVNETIVTVAATTCAVVAATGFGTWKRQLKGRADHDLSRRILLTLLEHRDAMRGVRSYVMTFHELPTTPEGSTKRASPEEATFHAITAVYEKRWLKVESARRSLHRDLLEAEVLWGTELKDLFEAVFTLENELFICVRHYLTLENPNSASPRKEAAHKAATKRRDILHEGLNDEPDEFKNDLTCKIKEIEKYLKPRLNVQL